MWHRPSHWAALVELLRRKRFVRAKDLDERGIPRVYLTRGVRWGRLTRIASGLYEFTNARHFEERDLALACALHPNGVVCLHSAAHFHELLPWKPEAVWLTQSPGAPRPAHGAVPIEPVYMRPALLEGVVESHERAGATIRVTSVEKTIVDLFRHRARGDLELAVEVLHEYVDEHGATDELMRVAAANRCRAPIEASIAKMPEYLPPPAAAWRHAVAPRHAAATVPAAAPATPPPAAPATALPAAPPSCQKAQPRPRRPRRC